MSHRNRITVPSTEKDLFKIVQALKQLIDNPETAETLGIASSLSFANGKFEVTAASSALTITLKTLDGADPSTSDPVQIGFRSSTGTDGGVDVLTVTSAVSLVISSGSTLGVTSSTAFRLWIVGFNDGGTFRLGVIKRTLIDNAANGGVILYTLNESGLNSATAEGGAGGADSAGVIYSDATVSSKPMRILGYAEWSASGLTAGTWTTTNLIVVQVMGPGIRKPGDNVMLVQTRTDQQTATTSTSYQTTQCAATIAPSSAANVIEVDATGNLVSTSATGASYAALFRDATALDHEMAAYNAAGGTNLSSARMSIIDAPNATSNTTYSVKVKTGDAGNTATFPNALGLGHANGVMTLKEIMA